MKIMLLRKSILGIILFAILTVLGCGNYEKTIPAPKIYFKLPESPIEKRIGDTLYLIPKITYNYDSQYKWYKNKEELSTELNIMHVSEKLGDVEYSFAVSTPSGKDSVSFVIRTIELIDFNNFTLNDNSYNTGDNLPDNSEGFIFGNLMLPNSALPEKKWEGFAMSNMYATNSFPKDTIYSAYGSTKTNRVFTILSLSNNSTFNTFNFNEDSAYIIGSIDVCNTTRVYNMIVYGDSTEIVPFQRKIDGYDGDYLYVKFKGRDNQGNNTGEIDFYLADYRFEKHGDVVIIKNFTPVDLTPLGAINKIVIEMYSSLNDKHGQMYMPPFVCFDNVKILEKRKIVN